MHVMRNWGRKVGSRWWRNILRKCVRKIFIGHNELRQVEVKSGVPVLFSLPQATGKGRSTNQAGVRPWECDCRYQFAQFLTISWSFLAAPPTITCIYTVLIRYWITFQSYISTFSFIFKKKLEKTAKLFITMLILLIFYPVSSKPT